ncbi:MAG: nickel pincer cofactor biosynthesis protein LarC [Phycisphaerae bacterium]
MSVAYFDCFAGAGGDMICASLIDAGLDFDTFRGELAKLNVPGYSVRIEDVVRRGIAGKQFCVDVEPGDKPHRHLRHVLEIIDAADIAPRAAERARKVFRRLAQAEAKVHGTSIETVHFHEVGAIDSIVDVVGACIGLEMHQVDTVHCGAVPTGSGTVQCDHGLMPVPAPATAELLVGLPTTAGAVSAEMTTPTAAAIFAALAESFGPIPEMTVSALGHGAGSRDSEQVPNVLRTFIGTSAGEGTSDSVVELAANLDDCSGEIIGRTIDKLLNRGCLDAWATPAVAKKSRPAWTLHVLVSPADVAAAERLIFTETTTFGIRRHASTRSKLARELVTVETRFGPIRVKTGRRDGTLLTASPEFDDCCTAADAHSAPVADVYQAAQIAFRKAKEQ